jgi:hypothetical protein
MDRRKLIVGGGVAAVATTLGAMAGSPAQAEAVRVRFGAASTAGHARTVLAWAKAELGLVDPAGLHRQFDRFHAAISALPTREPGPDDVEGWIRRRMKDLCGTDVYTEAAKTPQARTLMAFSLLVYSQNQGGASPSIDPRGPVPPTAESLEPDFLPVLLELINEKKRASREFAAAIDAAANELDLIVEAKVRELSNGDTGGDGKGGSGFAQAAPGEQGGRDFLSAVLAVLVFWVIGDWIYTRFKF